MVIPVTAAAKESGLEKLAKKQILAEVRKFDRTAEVELSGGKVVVRVENDVIPRIIGRGGETIKALQEHLGVHIDVSPKVATLGKEVRFREEETGAYIVFTFDLKQGKIANFYADEKYLFSATLGKNSQVRVGKDSDIGRDVLSALVSGRLKAFV